ncbi:MAG TPA: hypothetical protein VGC42_12170, partial [Kofleriaceae bacterium]
MSFALVGCHHDGGADHNPGDGLDAGDPADAGAPDSDGQPQPPGPDGIADVIAATDDATVALPVTATVTYLKPAITGAATDPPGFTVQGTRTGAAIFVAVDPATLTPPAQVGDVVSFTVTQKTT